MTEVNESEAPAPKRAPRATKTNVPHVYTALLAVLGEMSVAKGATLPSNMGGKPYITASDLNAEAKRQFVSQGLIFIPNERQVSKEIINDGGRKTVAISIEGTYTILSTQDGSSVEISGVGDGLATGTAVSSNIASTNALKNALLRTFLVTEQSVEDAAKEGLSDAPATPRALSAAKSGAPIPASESSNKVRDMQAQIKEMAEARGGVEYHKIGAELAGGKQWATDVSILGKVIQRLQEIPLVDPATGEVSD